MGLDEIQKEAQHQKLHGMPSEPTPGTKKGCVGKGFTILIIIIIIIAAIYLGLKGFDLL